ncbi:RHS repeat-associated core domain-containing protein, partial [Nocardia sp. GTS18]|uniref:RHS repeat-associated core domain-containing protein n=1 Tax=Nocardia sp. GTS18 TaxID=1778064 RepID=UPI001C680652
PDDLQYQHISIRRQRQMCIKDSTPAEPSAPQRMEGREYHNNLLVRDGRNHYYYDPAGRLIRKVTTRISRKPAVWHYRYNAFNQLTDVYTPEKEWWRYTYDALGRSSQKVLVLADGSLTRRFQRVWDRTELIEQFEGYGIPLRWQYRPGAATPITQSSAHELLTIIGGAGGIPTQLIDVHSASTAAVANSTLWGEIEWCGTTTTPLRYPGQVYESEAELNYNFFRMYDAATGRFLTSDPLGLSASPNPNSYVTNPTRWSDPLGLMPDSCENVTIYRSQDTNVPQTLRLDVDADGNVSHSGSGQLYLNMTGDISHSTGFKGDHIVAFDVPRSYVDSIAADSLPQRMPSDWPGTRREWNHARKAAPDQSDAPGLYGLPSGYISGLLDAIIPGSGRII